MEEKKTILKDNITYSKHQIPHYVKAEGECENAGCILRWLDFAKLMPKCLFLSKWLLDCFTLELMVA
jgi:hypothetical protein